MLRVGLPLYCVVHVLLSVLMKVSPALLLPATTSSPLPTPPPPPPPSQPPPSATPMPSIFSSSSVSSSSSSPPPPRPPPLPSSSSSSSSSPPMLFRLVRGGASSLVAGQRKSVVKRSTRFYGSFYRLMQRHSRFLSQQAFVEKMFRLFDMNADNLIERDEFRAIMRLLGLIHSSY